MRFTHKMGELRDTISHIRNMELIDHSESWWGIRLCWSFHPQIPLFQPVSPEFGYPVAVSNDILCRHLASLRRFEETRLEISE